MEMALRTSNLILPQGFVEMDREEMMYVDGGVYLNNTFCRSIVSFAVMLGCFGWGVTIASGSTAIVSSIIIGAKVIGAKILMGLNAFMGANPIFWALGAALVTFTLLNFDAMIEACVKIVSAAFQGKGVDIYISWFQLQSKVR